MLQQAHHTVLPGGVWDVAAMGDKATDGYPTSPQTFTTIYDMPKGAWAASTLFPHSTVADFSSLSSIVFYLQGTQRDVKCEVMCKPDSEKDPNKKLIITLRKINPTGAYYSISTSDLSAAGIDVSRILAFNFVVVNTLTNDDYQAGTFNVTTGGTLSYIPRLAPSPSQLTVTTLPGQPNMVFTNAAGGTGSLRQRTTSFAQLGYDISSGGLSGLNITYDNPATTNKEYHDLSGISSFVFGFQGPPNGVILAFADSSGNIAKVNPMPLSSSNIEYFSVPASTITGQGVNLSHITAIQMYVNFSVAGLMGRTGTLDYYIGGINLPVIIHKFLSDQFMIVANGHNPAHLDWEVSGASSISISPTVGGNLVDMGSATVTPTDTTTYTLTAVGQSATITSALTIIKAKPLTNILGVAAPYWTGEQWNGQADKWLTKPLAAQVMMDTAPFSNAPVTFTPIKGVVGLSTEQGGELKQSIQVTSGSDGLAYAYVKLNKGVGEFAVRAKVGSKEYIFTGHKFLPGPENFTEPTLAPERDNVRVPIWAPGITNIRISATPPKYTTLSNDNSYDYHEWIDEYALFEVGEEDNSCGEFLQNVSSGGEYTFHPTEQPKVIGQPDPLNTFPSRVGAGGASKIHFVFSAGPGYPRTLPWRIKIRPNSVSNGVVYLNIHYNLLDSQGQQMSMVTSMSITADNIFQHTMFDLYHIASCQFGPGYPGILTNYSHLEGEVEQFSIEVDQAKSGNAWFTFDKMWLEGVIYNENGIITNIPANRAWLIGSHHNQPNSFKSSGYENQDQYYAYDNIREFEQGLDEPSTECPDQINANGMNCQDIIFTPRTGLGGNFEVKFKSVTGTLQLKAMGWNGKQWINCGDVVYNSTNLFGAWRIDDGFFPYGPDSAHIRLRVIGADEGGATTSGAAGMYQYLHYCGYNHSTADNPSAVPPWQDDQLVVQAIRKGNFWRMPKTITFKARTVEAGTTMLVFYTNILYGKVQPPACPCVVQPNTQDWRQFLVIYPDGDCRLLPTPTPQDVVDLKDICFGAAVKIGPAKVLGRPGSDIQSVDFNTNDRSTMELGFYDGSSATVKILARSSTGTVIELKPRYDTTSVPACFLRSMYVRPGNSDIDSASDVNGTHWIDNWTRLSGNTWTFSRRQPSNHHTWAPDITMEAFPASVFDNWTNVAVLSNESFEKIALGGSDTSLLAWHTSGNVYREPIVPQCGGFHAKMYGNWSTSPYNYSEMYQDLPATPSQYWQGSIFAYLPDGSEHLGGENRVWMQIEFYNSANQMIGSEIPSQKLDSSSPVKVYTRLQATALAPAGTTYVRLRVLFEQNQYAGGSAYFDDAELTTVENPELLPNPSFDADATGWTLWTSPEANATFTRTTTAGEFDSAPAAGKVTATESGTAAYQVQLSTGTWDIEKGKTYQFTFRAKASTAFTIPSGNVKLMQLGSPYADYGTYPHDPISIGTGWHTYTIQYVANCDASDARVTFHLGNCLPDGASFYVDTLSLRRIYTSPEILPNPSFDADSTGWSFWTASEATATYQRTTTAGEFDSAPAAGKVTATESGTMFYQIQLATGLWNIEAGKTYQFKFRAKASTAFTIPSGYVKLMQLDSPWADYSSVPNADLNVTTDWKTYIVQYVANATASDARITFHLGGVLPDGASFYVDTLSLKEVQPDAELLPNPSFDSSESGWNLWTPQEVTASFSRTTTSGEYDSTPAGGKIFASESGTMDYQIQLSSGTMSIEAGKTYQLTFKAKASTAFTVPSGYLKLMQVDSPWADYSSVPAPALSLTTGWQTYTVQFVANTTASDTRIDFHLGGVLPDGASFYVDTLSLKELH